ncbi:MAG: O-antigen ligase family protein [candidate division KSB1 bacterium]|nr:O-antigen ligase family protein [candidate division KSB1 bacterium]
MLDTLKYTKSLQVLLFLLLALGIGLSFFVLSDLSTKILMAALAALSFPFILLIIGNVRKLLMGGIVLLIPLHIDVNFYHHFRNQAGAHTMGISAIDIFVLILLFLRLFELAVRKPNVDMHFYPRLSVPAILYIQACIITLLWAPQFDLAIMQIVEMIKLFFMYLVLANYLEKPQDLRFLVWMLALTVGMQGMIALLQTVTGGTLGLAFFGEASIDGPGAGPWRVMGTLGHPNRLAMYLEILLPLCVALFFIETRKLYKFALTAIIGLGLIALIMTGSRGAWVSFVFAMGVLFFFLLKSRRVRWKALVGPAFLTLFLLIVVSFVFSDMIYQRFYGEDHGSAMSRIPMMRIAFNLITDNPIGGVGINNYQEVMRQYNDSILGLQFETISRPVHNMYLLVMGETGVIGFSMLMLLMIMLIKGLLQTLKSGHKTIAVINMALLAGIGAMCLHGLVDKHPPSGYAPFYIIMAIAAASSHMQTTKSAQPGIGES